MNRALQQQQQQQGPVCGGCALSRGRRAVWRLHEGGIRLTGLGAVSVCVLLSVTHSVLLLEPQWFDEQSGRVPGADWLCVRVGIPAQGHMDAYLPSGCECM